MWSATRLFPSRRRAVYLGLTATALFLAGFSALSWIRAPVPPKYTTSKVARADIENSVLASGILQPIEQVEVGTRVSGQVKSLHVKLGDHAHAGQLLAEIDPVLPENELRGAQANLANLEAQKLAAIAKLRRSHLEFERQRGMIKGQATSRKDLEAAEEQSQADTASLAALEAQIAQAKSQVDIANANLSYTKITAPIEGEVVAVLTQVGQTVVAAQIVPVILKLARLDAMTIKTQVSEADILGVKPGQKVFFTVMGDPNKRHSGVLRTVELAPQSYSEPTVSQSGAQPANPMAGLGAAVFYSAWFDVPNPDRTLRIGLTAQVSIVSGVSKNALSIPAAALHGQGEDGRYTVRVRTADGQSEERKILVGVNNHAQAEVLEGLKEGEEVITREEVNSQGSRP